MSKLTIGLYLGDRHSQLCAVDAEGVVVREARVGTTAEALAAACPAADLHLNRVSSTAYTTCCSHMHA